MKERCLGRAEYLGGSTTSITRAVVDDPVAPTNRFEHVDITRYAMRHLVARRCQDSCIDALKGSSLHEADTTWPVRRCAHRVHRFDSHTTRTACPRRTRGTRPRRARQSRPRRASSCPIESVCGNGEVVLIDAHKAGGRATNEEGEREKHRNEDAADAGFNESSNIQIVSPNESAAQQSAHHSSCHCEAHQAICVA